MFFKGLWFVRFCRTAASSFEGDCFLLNLLLFDTIFQRFQASVQAHGFVQYASLPVI